MDISSRTDLQIPGFTMEESTFAIKSAYDAMAPMAKSLKFPSEELLKNIRTSEWPTLSKSVVGGLQHVISVENGANYMELWRQGGNWYAVTGAGQLDKGEIGDWKDINFISGVTKGMSIREVVPLFLKAMDCGCSKAK